MPAPRAQSSQPTVITEAPRLPALQTPVRVQALNTYDEARPGYVERSYSAGRDMERLARSLALLDDRLVPFLQNRLDERIAAQIAEGAELYANNPDLEKNRTNWKNFSEAHPEYSGHNPWLQKGYETARLQNLAFEETNALHEAYNTSNMSNEQDPEKVKAWAEEFTRNFRRERGLDTYEDKITLAQYYSSQEFRSRAQLMGQHDANIRQQRMTLLQQEMSQFALNQIGSGADPAGAIQNAINEACMNGLPNSRAGEMGVQLIETVYQQRHQARNLLKLFDQVKTREGVSLSSLPGVAAHIARLEQQAIEQARSAARHDAAMRAASYQLQKQEYEGPKLIAWLTDPAFRDLPPSIDNMKKFGVPEEQMITFSNSLTRMRKGMVEGFGESPEGQKAWATARTMAAFGALDMSFADCTRLFGPKDGEALWKANRQAQSDEGRVIAGALKLYGVKVYGMFGRNRDDPLALLAGGSTADLAQEQKIGLEAMQYFCALMQDEVTELKNRNPDMTPEMLEQKLAVKYPELALKTHDAIRKQYPDMGAANSKSVPPPRQGANAGQAPSPAKPEASEASAAPAADNEWDAFLDFAGVPAEHRVSKEAVRSWIMQNRPDLKTAFIQAMQGT